MNLKDKNILIMGLGVSGVSTIKALSKLGANIVVSDLKSKNELKEYIKEIHFYPVEYFLGTNNVPLDNIDLIVKSPGIPLNVPVIQKAKEKNIEVITDIELGYRIKPESSLIAITGTNGKTTTATLAGEFFKKTGLKCHVVGNIGVGILLDLVNSSKEDVFVVETSSFQLENTINFKPSISLVLNISPDHINWHGSYNNYINSKKKIFLNQDKNDFTILNYDDPLVRNMKDEINSNIFWFSVHNILDKGVYINKSSIVINDGREEMEVISCKDLKIPGKHNLQNILASISIGWLMELDIKDMASVLKDFKGLEHRIEYVTNIKGIGFYNDSKGTNPISSIEAIKALKESIILIAGGMDKGSNFQEFVKSFNGRVKDLILLGETSEKIKEAAIENGFENIYIVEDMESAVKKSFELGNKGDKVLLSPACASWDMYKSYEDRGLDFKKAVLNLKEG